MAPSMGWRLLPWLIGAVLAWAMPAFAQAVGDPRPQTRRGPLEAREEWLLAQPRLTLPPTSPDPLRRGETEVRVDLDWGNDFGWDQQLPGEIPGDRRFLVDGEHRTMALTVRRGVRERLGLGLRLPLRWRGPGIMDGVIDSWHRLLRGLGVPDNGRSRFLANRLRVEGRDREFRPVRWRRGGGSGLGNLELEARWTFLLPPGGRGWSAALIGRATAPTGSGPFDASGVDAGVQLVAARPLALALDVYFGLGGTALREQELDGIRYARERLQAFLVLEWRPTRRWSVLAETSGASRLVTNLAAYPAVQSYLKIGSKIGLGRRYTLEAGFTENLLGQEVTTDFGIMLGMTRRF